MYLYIQSFEPLSMSVVEIVKGIENTKIELKK